ncbi:MAG: NAD(P)/FAD-dependent oxidoreductase [Proteobacteria bacterium]|nr:NAD(P)/FAD-dependent oxidoreductase [Pseudomonadota bacterium]
MAKHYDLIVIGTGTAASVAAFACRRAGWQVAMVDHLPFGGTCALRGCDPKKVLVGVAEALDQSRRLRGKGLAGGLPALDWRELMTFKRSFTDPIPPRREKDFHHHGIETFHARARFRGPQTIEAGGELLEARFILIAAGAVPAPLKIQGEEHLVTNSDFLELDELPQRLVLVGGGYIAAEFSHVAVRAGAQVTILHRGDRLLKQFDPDLVQWLTEKSRGLGIDIRLHASVQSIEKVAKGLRIHFDSDGTALSVEADLAVHAAGRVPDLDSLDLHAGGIAREGAYLKLNEFLQSTSNPAVYAAGDAAERGPPLTPVASHDGRVAARNMLEGNREVPNYLGVPSVVFTIPALARVGLPEDEARRQNLHFRLKMENTASWYTARRVAEDCAGYKVLVEEGTERILGAHLIGPQAEEVINFFALAIRNGLPASKITGVFGYPTAASDIGYMVRQ